MKKKRSASPDALHDAIDRLSEDKKRDLVEFVRTTIAGGKEHLVRYEKCFALAVELGLAIKASGMGKIDRADVLDAVKTLSD